MIDLFQQIESQSKEIEELKVEIKRLKSDNEALRISAKFVSDDDIEANLRNQVYNLDLENQRLKEENEAAEKVIEAYYNPHLIDFDEALNVYESLKNKQ